MLCKVCNEDLHENNFYLKDKETNRRATICKECYNYKRNRNHNVKQEIKKIPVIKRIPNTCNTNNTINTIEVKEEIKKIPSSMEYVMTMINSKKYNNSNNRNVEFIMYSAIVGFKTLLGNKKKPVTQVKQEIKPNYSKKSFGQAMIYDDG
jgi:hypothetical protein